jgi:broad specificity phosphatase PhoE
MRILLVRHGETDWNRQGRCQGATDLDLNETGVRQAEKVAADLTKEEIHVVYSSNLKRAIQTARVICRPHGLAVTIDDGFRELHHGKLEGLTLSDIQVAFPDFIQKWRQAPADLLIPGGERLVDVAGRAWEGMNRIVQCQRSDATVVVVSHNFPILAILCRITGVHLDRYRSFHIDPCNVTHLSYTRTEGWRLVEFGDEKIGSHPVSQNDAT